MFGSLVERNKQYLAEARSSITGSTFNDSEESHAETSEMDSMYGEDHQPDLEEGKRSESYFGSPEEM